MLWPSQSDGVATKEASDSTVNCSAGIQISTPTVSGPRIGGATGSTRSLHETQQLPGACLELPSAGDLPVFTAQHESAATPGPWEQHAGPVGASACAAALATVACRTATPTAARA